MKLFYHFLFFVFASLILLACANMFASDPQSQSQTEEISSPQPGGNGPTDDSIISPNSASPLVLTALKNKAIVPLKGKTIVGKKYAYMSSFETALDYFGSPKKFK